MLTRDPQRRLAELRSSSGSAAAVAAALVLAGIVAGCGVGQAADAGSGTQSGSWQLASGVGADGPIETLASHRITLVLEDDRVGGTAACNSYGAPVRIDGERFEVRDLALTEMACDLPVMAAEAAYVDALRRVDTIRRHGEQLVLAGPSVELRFDVLPPVPTQRLVDTRWELDTVLDGDVASTAVEPAATLRIDGDGSLEGETGCRDFSGRYVLRGDEVRVTELAVADGPTAGVCTARVVEQERIVLEVLGDGFRAQVEGARLTLTPRGSSGLVYRAS